MSEQRDLEQFGSVDSSGEQQSEEQISEPSEPAEHGTARFPSLPTDWAIKRLDEVTTVQGGSTPSTDEEEYWGGEIHWATPTDLTELRGNTISDTADLITEAGLESSSTHVLPPYSVLLTSRAGIGKCAVNTVPMATNQGFQSLIPGEELNTWYLYYVITEMAPYLESIGSGSTFSEISKREVQRIEIPVPSMEEQLRIASVLRNTEKTAEIATQTIDRLARLDQGLQQVLFRHGPGEHDLKETETMGEIPSHWDVVPLKDVAEITMGTSPKSEYYNTQGEGLPFFQANNEFGHRNPTHDRWCSNPVKKATSGDVLMTIRGTYVGQVNMANLRCCIGRGLAGITPKKVNGEYLYHHLRFRENYVKSIATGSTFDSVSSTEIKTLPVAIPPEDEQQQIADGLKAVQKLYIREHDNRDKITTLRNSQRRQLISGSDRLSKEEIDIIDEVHVDG